MKALTAARALLGARRVPAYAHRRGRPGARRFAHYANELKSAHVFLTETERSEGSALGELVSDVMPHVEVPVSILH